MMITSRHSRSAPARKGFCSIAWQGAKRLRSCGVSAWSIGTFANPTTTARVRSPPTPIETKAGLTGLVREGMCDPQFVEWQIRLAHTFSDKAREARQRLDDGEPITRVIDPFRHLCEGVFTLDLLHLEE